MPRGRIPASKRRDLRRKPALVLQRDSAIPLYHQLAVFLEGEIASGKFTVGERYYSDRTLVDQFEISLLTVRQAVNELVEKHLLRRERGSGTYVEDHAERIAGKTSAVRGQAILFTGWRLEALSGWDAMYFRDIVDGIHGEAASRGYALIMDDMVPTTPDLILDDMRLRQIKGVVALSGAEARDRSRLFSSAGLKVVTVNCMIDALPAVLSNDQLGCSLIVSHLLSLGHRRFVHLNSGEPGDHWVDVDKGYRLAMADAGLSLGENPVITSSFGCGSIEAGYECMKKALKVAEGVTAVVAGNDLMAIGALRFLRDEGIDVPSDISVTGFDDILASEICEPPLTTVHVDRIELGRDAVRILLAAEPVPERTQIPVTITERRSTARPNQGT